MEGELARERTLLGRQVCVAAVHTALVVLSSLPHMLGGGHPFFLPLSMGAMRPQESRSGQVGR